jgi:DHA1 family putative efflux transporter-like MFS transporter
MNRLNIYLLALGAFLVATAELVVAGILNVIAEDLQISIGLAGQLITVYSLAYAVGTPILVSLTSRIRRKSLLVGSLAIFILGCLASFGGSNYTILMVSRVILGLSAGLFIVVALSSVAKLVPTDKTGSAIGTIVLGFSSAMLLGVPIGIAITHWWSWQVIFMMLGLASMLVMIGMIRLLPEIEGDAPISFKQQFAVLRNPIIVSGLLISFLYNTGNSFMFTYLTPFLQNILHMSTSNIGMMMLVLGIFGVIGTRVGGLGIDKWGTARVVSCSLAVNAASLVIVTMFSASFVVGIVFLTIWVGSMFVTAPAIQTYFIQQAPQSSNFVLSLNTSITHLGVAIGAGVGGMIVNSTSTVLHNPWIASCTYALGLATAIISFSLRKRKTSAMFG